MAFVINSLGPCQSQNMFCCFLTRPLFVIVVVSAKRPFIFKIFIAVANIIIFLVFWTSSVTEDMFCCLSWAHCTVTLESYVLPVGSNVEYCNRSCKLKCITCLLLFFSKPIDLIMLNIATAHCNLTNTTCFIAIHCSSYFKNVLIYWYRILQQAIAIWHTQHVSLLFFSQPIDLLMSNIATVHAILHTPLSGNMFHLAVPFEGRKNEILESILHSAKIRLK